MNLKTKDIIYQAKSKAMQALITIGTDPNTLEGKMLLLMFENGFYAGHLYAIKKD